MFKFVSFISLIALVAAKPGHLATHSVVEQAHVGSVVHSVPSAVSTQEFTRVHNSAVVSPVLAPVVKSYVAAPEVHTAHVVQATPVVHASSAVHVAPVLHSASVVHSAPVVQAAPALHSASVYHSAPVVHSAPVLHSASVLHTAPVVHSVHAAPLKTVVSPVSYSLHH